MGSWDIGEKVAKKPEKVAKKPERLKLLILKTPSFVHDHASDTSFWSFVKVLSFDMSHSVILWKWKFKVQRLTFDPTVFVSVIPFVFVW